MKSTDHQLEERGFIPDEELIKHKNISYNNIIVLLNSSKSSERTLGAKISGIKKDKPLLPLLCDLLSRENKLYTKIALSESIAEYGTDALEYLLPLLGKIGNNRHTKPALVDINKKSYPLPRDLAARIIIRIGETALPSLEKILVSGTYTQKVEAIDAIGHIAFNFNNTRSEESLHRLLNENNNDELIIWKIIRAFQSFCSIKTEELLNSIVDKSNNSILKEEARRSLRRMSMRKKQAVFVMGTDYNHFST